LVATPDGEGLTLVEPVDEGVAEGDAGAVVPEADPEPEELVEGSSAGASTPPHPAATAPTRAIATAAVRRGRTRVVEREVTPRR